MTNNRYGIIPTKILDNLNISLGAKGLFAYLQGKPEKWDFSIARVAEQNKNSRNSIRRKIYELKKFGYLQKVGGKIILKNNSED